MNSSSNFEQLAQTAKQQSLKLASLTHAQRNHVLKAVQEQIIKQKDAILKANEKDLQSATKLNPALLNRLKLDAFKTQQLATYLDTVANLPDPLGQVQLKTQLDAGLILSRVSCPIGVLAVIFESRPEVVIQVSALALKSGNAVLLKGGSEAKHTNKKLFEILNQVLKEQQLLGAVQLLESREAIQSILDKEDYIDLIIPRGSNQLVKSIQDNTNITVLGHSSGVCHVYIDEHAKPDMAARLILDSKLDYPAACNAVETLLVHQGIATTLLPVVFRQLASNKVSLLLDKPTLELAQQLNIPAELASEEEWFTEYTDLKLSIKQVSSTQAAVQHINHFGSGHTDAIVTEDEQAKNYFYQQVDSACVFHNASTRFSDGFVFGLGAEVGISTHKIHARGPVGLEGLLTYKYQLNGQGQIKADYAGENAKPLLHKALEINNSGEKLNENLTPKILPATVPTSSKLSASSKLPASSHVSIWTDGACSQNPGPGGWAAILEVAGERTELAGANQSTTNNQMELTAVIQGLKHAPVDSDISLMSDSKYVIDGITKWVYGWKKKNWKTAGGTPVKNQSLWFELVELSNNRKVDWQWTKGHAGHSQNERCDALARAQIEKLTGGY